jgi:3'-phosphoadenosine 5'-phosphosulfate sulfotransferase (PAPS reductase)/FAD synthetase
VIKHVLNISGGKDSTALYLLALESGRPFLPVMADTGHEHPATLEYVHDLSRSTGGPRVRIIKADFTAAIIKHRMFIARDQRTRRKDGRKLRWTNKAKRRALSVLHPTGNPFLDLCLLKGRFPSTRARFCSQELKHRPIFSQIIGPLLDDGHLVVSWQGVRADETPARALLPVHNHDPGGHFNFRPILHWTWQKVFDLHHCHGIEVNPLYLKGCGRVGCLPCIHATKNEIKIISRQFPEEVARVAEWENLVSRVSKRGQSTFFSVDKTPGPHQADHNLPMPGIYDVVAWSKTCRGGRQFDLMVDDTSRCSSIYGLCA